MASELGWASAGNGYGPLDEDNWALRWPQSTAVYAKMSREDSQVKAILKAVTLPVRRATWRVNPNGAPETVVNRVAGDLRLPVLGGEETKPPYAGRVSWTEHLQRALLSLTFGHMFFEQVYEADENDEEHLVKLAPRMPGSIASIEVADDGGLVGVEQQPLPGRAGKPFIPVDRLVAYVYEPVGLSWTGESILRPCYKHWVLRDRLLKLECSTLDRNGMGVPVYKASDLFTDDEDRAQDLENGRAIAAAVRSGDTAGVAVPPGASLDIKGTSGQLLSPRPAIAYHDSMMAKSVLAHFLNLEAGGSYALAQTQADLFIQSLQTTADWVADVASKHIVEDLIRIAFPDYDGPMPFIFCDPIASKKELTAEAMAQLINAGAIHMDPATEQDLRRRFSMCPKDEEYLQSRPGQPGEARKALAEVKGKKEKKKRKKDKRKKKGRAH